MPITKRNGKYYWGSKGPFNSRKEAKSVQQAAYASGYEKMVGSPVGASSEGVKPNTAQDVANREKRLTKEDGGTATVFTSSDAGIFTPTHGGQGVRPMSSNQQKKHKKRTGVEKLASFMDERSPHVFSKDLDSLNSFIDKSGFPSDNFESQNRMNNPKRLDWKKKKDDDTQHSVAYNQLPEGQFYKDRGPAYLSVAGGPADQEPKYVERSKNNQDKEKWSESMIAHQNDMEKKIRGYDKESKKRHNDADEPPGHALGGAAGQIDYSGLNKMEGSAWTREGAGTAGDALHRGGDKDKIPPNKNEKTEEETQQYINNLSFKKNMDSFMARLQLSIEDEMS